MGDEIKNDEEAGPSASKKERNENRIDDEDSNDVKSDHEQRDRDRDQDRDHDARSYTESSASYRSRNSVRSAQKTKSRKDTDLRIFERRSDPDGPERRRRVRRGRVRKPRRSAARKRYHPVRRSDTKRRTVLRQVEESVSSIGGRSHSTRSIIGVASRICGYCGHRCCSRRCNRHIGKYSCRRSPDPKTITRQLKKCKEIESKKNKRNIKRNAKDRKKTTAKERNKTKPQEKVVISDSVQKGSRCKMLSPLFVSTNERLGEDDPREESFCLEITPEIICDTVEILTKWKQSVPIAPIANYILQRYPVNQNMEMLMEELSSKLAVATITGILQEEIKNNVRQWSLSCELMRRGLTMNQVTLFWKVFCDTMQPIRKRILGYSGISPQQIERYLVDKKACYSNCNKCKSLLPVSRCLSHYLWSTPCIFETTYVRKRNYRNQSDRHHRSQKLAKSNRKNLTTRKAYPQTRTPRKYENKLEQRPRLHGISKRISLGSRKQKNYKNIAKQQKSMIIYDLEHRNSVLVTLKRRRRQQSENYTNSFPSKYISNMKHCKTTKHFKTTNAITIKDSFSSVPKYVKMTSNRKKKGNKKIEIVTIQEVKQTTGAKSSEYLFDPKNFSLAKSKTSVNNVNLVNKNSEVKITNSKGRISSKGSCDQSQNPIEMVNDDKCCLRSLPDVDNVANRNNYQNSINNLRGCRTEGNIAAL